MPTNFPGALDDFSPNPVPTDPRSNPSLAGKITNLSDAMEAVQATVGVTNSAVPTSLEYRVDALESAPAVSGSPGPLEMPTAIAGWVCDPLFIDSTTIPRAAAGTLTLVAIYLPEPATVDGAYMFSNTVSATATFCGLWQHAAGGALLATSPNHGAILNPGLAQVFLPFTAPVALPKGWVYYGFWFTGGGVTNSITGKAGLNLSALTNSLTVASQRRAGTADTGLTTTFPATLGAQLQTTSAPWAALRAV
jgi:hypothetical protein